MKRRILLADDSVTIQKVIELTFMDDDYVVSPVSNGDDAIKALPDVDPDFVIADVHMPGANGYEVCRRSKERRPDVPVLLLVGTFEPFDEAQARAAGADSYLKKPFDSQELLQRVGELLAGSRPPAAAPGPAETVRVSAMPDLGTSQETMPPPPPVEEWRGFEIEAEPESLGAGSEFALEETAQDWHSDSNLPEGEPMFELEEPAPGADVFGFEPQPIAAAPHIEAPPPASLERSHEPLAVGAAAAVAMAAPLGNGLSDADVDRIARRVVELLGDKAIRDVAWEVVPDLAEVVIRDRLRELESQAENFE
ncbi:MAG TPA: response regulator [Thermoanaerobaculia bacterium]|nr:response regulator [Thermoanaerobaculia bacterium]